MRTRSKADSDPLTYTYARSVREIDAASMAAPIEGPTEHVLAFVGALRPERRRHCIPVAVERRRRHFVKTTWQQRAMRWLRKFINHRGGL